ncbi:MAG TPA: fused MFS/spermidine synthase [Casimicrobiaceae bacterium]|jgi:spermidine synthase
MRASRFKRLVYALAVAAPLASATDPGIEVLHRERSLYRNIFVYEEDGLRCMAFTRTTMARQSCVILAEPTKLVFNYARMMMAALYLNPAPQRILILGVGGGTLPSALQRLFPSASIDAVEIDPAVVRVARRFFAFEPGRDTRVYEEDGRVFVKRMQRQGVMYNLIVLDAFDHEYIPEHMLTREFLLEVKSLLADRGVLAANTFSVSKLYDYESATYYSVFGDFFGLKKNNRVILWQSGGLPPKSDIVRNADLLETKLAALGVDKTWLLPQIEIERGWPPATRVLTDQFSPSNLLNGPH